MRIRWKRPISAALAAVMTVSLVPFSNTARAIGLARVELPNATAHYDMSHSGDQLLDVSGNENHATLYDTSEEDFFIYEGKDVLRFANKQYATLPQGLITAADNNCSVEITMSVEGANSSQWAWVIGDGIGTWNEDNVGDYLFVSPKSNQGSFGGKVLTAVKVGSAQRDEIRSSVPDTGWSDGYHTITVVSEDQTITTYLDGESISTLEHTHSIADIIPDGEVLGYLGRSLYAPDDKLTANVLDMKVYDEALSAEQVKASLSDTTDAMGNLVLQEIATAMLGHNTSLEQVTENLTFPTQVGNAQVTWGDWVETDILEKDGTVHRVPDADTTITIPVSFAVNGVQYDKSLTVVIKALIVEDALAEALASIDIPNKDDVRGNITLPETSAAGGWPVSWSTDHPEIVNVNVTPVADYDDMPAGVVTRPVEDTQVTVTATVEVHGETASKDFVLTVKAAPEPIDDADYTDYFFTYFAGEGYSDGEQIFFAASQDGLNWTDLNDNQPILTTTMGEKGVRDPFIIRSPEGDKFYMIATDLKIYGNGDWGGAQTNGSQALMVWESTDLIHWSDQRMVTVSAGIDAGCTWAPEATYDDRTGEYVVYWASKVADDNYGKQRLYYAKTRDFYTFTEPQVYIDLDESSIDTTILYENGTYYRYTKNEGGNTNELGANTKTIFIEKSDALLGTWTHIPSDSLNSNQWVEGPTIFKFNQDDQANGAYCLLVDDFGGRGYYPLVTDDLESGVFNTPDTDYKMPTRARHGTPIRITAEEYQRVMETYNGPTELPTVEATTFDFADFTVEGTRLTDGERNISLQTVGNGTAPALVQDSERGQVLRLYASDYNNRAFAQLPYNPFAGADVSSGLTLNFWTNTLDNPGGANCLIDFEVAPATTGRAGTFAVNQGMVYWNTTDQNSAYTDFNTGSIGWAANSGWKMVTVVITTEGISFYCNGVKVSHTIQSGTEDYVQMINDLVGNSGYCDPMDTNVRLGASMATYWNSPNALLDDISFYRAALTDAQIYALWEDTCGQDFTETLEPGYYVTVYSTTTNFYASAWNVEQETQSVYLAVSSDGKNFEVLNNGGGVIFSKNPDGTLCVTEPRIFQDGDGKFVVVARDADASKGYHVFTSEDGVHYYDDSLVPSTEYTAAGLKKGNFTLMLDGENLLKQDGGITLGNALQITEAEYNAIRNKLGTVKNNGMEALNVLETTAGELTEALLAEQYPTVTATYTDGSTKEFNLDWTNALEGVELTDGTTVEVTAKVVQTKYLNNLKELNGSTLPEDDPDNENPNFPDNYDPATGTVYYDETKFIEGMADPCIFWDEQTGYYYMTGSYFPEEGDQIDGNDNLQQYDRIVLRKAKTLEGLQDRSQQVTIWKAGNQGFDNNGTEQNTGSRYIWAPEIHRVGDYWVVYFTESHDRNNVFNIYSHALILDGNLDPYETALTASDEVSQWKDYKVVSDAESSIDSLNQSFNLDMTYFKDEASGISYVCWAGKPTTSYQGSSTDLFIATIDESTPWRLTSQQVRLTCSDYGWERVRYCVNEGPTVLQHNGDIFLCYSASGTGSEYTIGMLQAKNGTDLLNASNWTKNPYPLLTSRDVDGEEGPGHNSFTVDQDGNVIFVYHARPTSHNDEMCGWDGENSSYNSEPLNDPCRHARLKRVHWAEDGTPILKMTYDNELLEENQTVTLTVKLAGDSAGGDTGDSGSTGGSGSGESSSGSSDQTNTVTVINPDGSTTTTVIKPDGTTIVTTKMPDGSTSVVTTSKDGKMDVVVDVSEEALENAAGTVTLPMPEVTAPTDPDRAPSVTVGLPVDIGVKVEIPVANVTAGTVAVLVKPDGTEEVIKTSVATENGIVVTLFDDDTVKIVDNSKEFDDVPDSFWGADAVDFVTSRELFNGTSATQFTPNGEMTRAMIVTVLARLEGVDTTTGSTWYEAGQQWAMEQGISDGTNMLGSLTREQLAAMLYRYAGSPVVNGTITGFDDAASVSSWAMDAMTWAVQNGILAGSNGNLNPQGNATRAEVATMLMRFIEKTA